MGELAEGFGRKLGKPFNKNLEETLRPGFGAEPPVLGRFRRMAGAAVVGPEEAWAGGSLVAWSPSYLLH